MKDKFLHTPKLAFLETFARLPALTPPISAGIKPSCACLFARRLCGIGEFEELQNQARWRLGRGGCG